MFENIMNAENFPNVMDVGGLEAILGPLFIALLIVMIIVGIALYIYTSIAWYTIAKKLKHKKPWLAWIPFANVALMLELGEFHWAWVFLFLIPIAGWIAIAILIIIANWRAFEKRKHPGWFSLAVLIPYAGFILYLIAIGLVAWQENK